MLASYRSRLLYARLSLASTWQEYDRAMAGLAGHKSAVAANREIAAQAENVDPGGA